MPGSRSQFSLSQMLCLPDAGNFRYKRRVSLGSDLQDKTATCPRDPPMETAVPQEQALTTRERVSQRRPEGGV